MKTSVSKFFPAIFLLMVSITLPLMSEIVDEVRWLKEHQRYDLVLNPETIPQMTDHPFRIYPDGDTNRLVISDRSDGLWRIEKELRLFKIHSADEDLPALEGDQHTLSFFNAQNILIERLDIYAHEVEEALKFSSCANVVVRDCRLIASRNSEESLDIVRGHNYIFDDVWFIGLGVRAATIKGSARYVDIVESQFGLRTEEAFREVFGSDSVSIGDKTFFPGDNLMPREEVPSWIYPCLLLSDERSLAVELGAWSDYDIGHINEAGEREERPPTSNIRVYAEFAHAMADKCDKEADMVPVLQWHTAEIVESSGWIFRPTETDVFGDLVEYLYYEISEPSDAREAEIRAELGDELDYWGVELPRYAIDAGEFGNNRFFGALYNAGNRFVYSPFVGWIFTFHSGLLGHDTFVPGKWIYHYGSGSYYMLLHGGILPNAFWWNASDRSYYFGEFNPL